MLHEIWNGKLPVEFSLAADEIITLDQPKPVYVNFMFIFIDAKK